MASARTTRVALFCAALSVLLCVYGWIRVVMVFRPIQPNVIPWIAVPLAAATGGMLFSLTRWFGPIWLCTGALLGFVVLGVWSVGLFFGYAALAMLAAGFLHLRSVQPGRHTPLAAVWTLIGAGAVSTAFFVRDVIKSNQYVQVQHAPVVVWGTWLFVAMLVLLPLLTRAERRTATEGPR